MARMLLASALFGLLLSSFTYECSGEDVFASSAHLRIVAEGERNMMNTLKEYVSFEQERLSKITSLIAGIDDVYNAPRFINVEEYVGNPLNAFHLIKRFSTLWRDIWQVASNFRHYEDLRRAADSIAAYIPQDEDYKGALASVIRLQNMYLLQTKDLTNGLVMSGAGAALPAPSAPLSQRACFDLAQAAIQVGESSRAKEWYETAMNNSRDPIVPSAWILYGLAHLEASKGDLVASSRYIEEARITDPENLFNLSSPQLNVATKTEPEWLLNYRELCRQSVLNGPQQVHNPPLNCEVRRSPNNPLSWSKVEWLNRRPDVQLFHGFISNAESAEIKRRSKLLIQRAKVGTSVDAQVSNERIGKVAWLWTNSKDEFLVRLEQRISDVTRLDTVYPAAEPLQASNYGIGGHYEPHYDHDEHLHSRTEVAPEVALSGDRIATFMVYMNYVKAGGATVFPKIGLYAKPEKNAAIFWYNYKQSGEGDTNTLHAGCPVLLGEKWVANKWIRQFGQEFRRPCSISPEL